MNHVAGAFPAGQAATNKLFMLQLAKDHTRQAEELCSQADAIQLPVAVDDGPCRRELDKGLQQHNVKRQKYHGGTFQGGDIQRPLKVMKYEKAG